MTHLLWLVLFWSPPHTHTSSSALPPASCSFHSRRGKCFFSCSSFSLSFFTPASFHFTHISVFNKTRLSRLFCGSDMHTHTHTCSHLTLITRLTGSCFISCVVVSWQPMLRCELDSVWWQLLASVFVHGVCYIMNEI